jgi:tetraacyldisaccharide 4'-kinase
MASSISEFVTKSWYQGAFWLYLLWPLYLIYSVVTLLRKYLYKSGIFKSYRAKVPVVVVGNITLGGTGKSPLVAYLVDSLKEMGFKPGVVSRGYGATISSGDVREVNTNSLVSEVGDEPLMLKQRVGCPIFVSPTRALAVQALEKKGCDIVITDDGLQHYALDREIEICVFDGERKWGNGHLLPMGPMREPLNRIKATDFVVMNGADWMGPEQPKNAAFRMDLKAGKLRSLVGEQTLSLSELKGKEVDAIAGIGNPERFFNTLVIQGLLVESHRFSDHHTYTQSDVSFECDRPLIMTEKDAVKCQAFNLQEAWYLPVSAKLSGDLAAQIVTTLKLKGWFNG